MSNKGCIFGVQLLMKTSLRYIILHFGLLLSLISWGQQEIYVVNENSELLLVDLLTCESSLVTVLTNPNNGATLEPFDIAIAADGFMYFIDNSTLYRLNLNTLVITVVGFNLDNFYSTGLVGNADGNLVSYDELGNISIISTVNADATLIGDTGFLPGGDVTFYNGELLLVSGENQVVLVNENNTMASTVYTTIPFPDQFFWGLVSMVETCENQVLYATSTFGVVQINLATGLSTLVCENISTSPIYGATSVSEYLADDCVDIIEIEIDLDADDSSGATGANFNAGEGCLPTSFPVADIDASITANFPVESITLQLNGVLDVGEEIITVPELPGIAVITNNSTSVQILNTAPLSNEELAAILAASNYNHTGLETTPGARFITVQAFLDGEVSNLANTFIEFVEPYAGEDIWLGFCPGTVEDGNDLLEEDVTPGGQWFSPGGQLYDGIFEYGQAPGVYTYQVVLYGCFDQALWTYNNNEPTTGSLALVSPLCDDSCTGSITAFPGEGSQLLSPVLGEDNMLSGLCPGEYEFRFINDDGCVLVERRDLFALNNLRNCGLRDEDLPPIYVPNAFTPDGDGINDVFKAESAARFRSFTMRIYNRWGEQVFASDSIHSVWQGNANNGSHFVPDGVYVWVIDYAYANSSKTGRLTGHVVMVR